MVPPRDGSETGSAESVQLAHFSSEGCLSGVSSEAPPDRTVLHICLFVRFFWKLYGEFQQRLGRLSLADVCLTPHTFILEPS